MHPLDKLDQVHYLISLKWIFLFDHQGENYFDIHLFGCGGGDFVSLVVAAEGISKQAHGK